MTVYDYAGAAAALNIPQSWIEKNCHRFPHLAFGKYIRFDDEDLAVIKAMHRVQPDELAQPAESAPLALLDLKPGRAPRGRRVA